MPNRNRTAGHNWERQCKKYFEDVGYKDVLTSRYASREMDDKKVDLVNTDPFYIQCKLSNTKLDYIKILEEMPNDPNHINIVMAKLTKKSGNRFINKGEIVVMNLKDFMNYLYIRDYNYNEQKQNGTN